MPEKKPNVLFLLTDDQRYGTIHALGNDEIITPNMDWLVEHGTSFMDAHIPGGTASAVCMPSRAMINSGKNIFYLEECGKNIPPEHITMGQTFLNNGYHCFETGKWHNGTESFSRSFDSAENIFFGGMWDHWNVPVSDFRENGIYNHLINFVPNFSANMTPVKVIADRIHAGVHSTNLFSDSAIKFIQEYSSSEPFFMYISFLAPHDPRTMPEEYRNMYNPEAISLPPNFQEMPSFDFGWNAKGRDETTEAYPRKPDKIKKHIADYYAMISHIDSQIGSILQALNEKGFLNNTIIVFAGDNGLAIGQHGLMGKQNVYEHSVKLPLVLCGPGIPSGERRNGYIYLQDIYPTLCDLCEIETPKSVDGISFAPMLKDPDYKIREDIYLVFQARIRGIIRGGMKLIEYRSEQVKLTQLFNLLNDPWEMNNLAGTDGSAEIVSSLRKRMEQYRDDWNELDNEFGRLYWKQYQQYKDAEVHGVPGPKGSNMKNQVKDWFSKA